MPKILKFPRSVGVRPIRLRSKAAHMVHLRVTSKRFAELARSQAQFAIERGCGFGGLKEWTNDTARSGDWFTCRVSAALISRFVRHLNLAMMPGTLEVWIDDQAVRLAA